MQTLFVSDSCVSSIKHTSFFVGTCVAVLLSALLWAVLPRVAHANSPQVIVITSDNELDFIDLDQRYRRRPIFCRISSADIGSVAFTARGTRWINFPRMIANARRRLRVARRNDNMQRARRIRRNIRAIRTSSPSLHALCSESISSLGVTPRPSPTPTPLTTPAPIPTPPASFQPIRINSGGPSDFHPLPSYIDSRGNEWVNDTSFFGVNSYFHAKEPIPGTSDQEIWMTERYGPAFSYRIPLEHAAHYTVVLHLGEIFWHQPGQRIFDVYLEGTQVISRLDLISSLGRFVPNVHIFSVNVTDGILDIDFFGVEQYAKINGIEILRSPADYEPLF